MFTIRNGKLVALYKFHRDLVGQNLFAGLTEMLMVLFTKLRQVANRERLAGAVAARCSSSTRVAKSTARSQSRVVELALGRSEYGLELIRSRDPIGSRGYQMHSVFPL